MRQRWKSVSAVAAAALVLSAGAATVGASSQIDLTFDYPVGVSGPLAKIMDNMVGQFNRSHPGIHVTPVYDGSYQQTLAKVETSIQAGSAPAVAVLNHTAVFDLLHLQAIAPMDTIVEQGDFYPAMLDPKVGGHFWSAPFQRSTVVLYYDKTLFRKAGLNPNAGPANWTQLLNDAQAIKRKTGVWGIEIPSDGTVYWEFAPFAIEAGRNLDANNGTTVYFDSPAAKTALQFWMNLSHRYGVEPTGILPWATTPQVFEQGQAGMIVHSSGSLAAILAGAKFPVGVSFMPKDVSSQRTDMGGGDLYIFKGLSKARKAAAETFVRWMTSPAQAAEWSMNTGYVAVTPRAYQTPSMRAYLKRTPQAGVAPEQLAYADPELSTYQLNEVQDIMDSAIQSVLDGQSTINAALSSAQNQAQALLAQYR